MNGKRRCGIYITSHIYMCVCVCVYVYNGVLCSPKKNEIMPSAATWVYLKIITLGELNCTEKHKYNMILFICGT